MSDALTPRRRRTALAVLLAVAALCAVAAVAWTLWPQPDTPRSDFDAASITLAAWCAPDPDTGTFPQGISRIDKDENENFAWAEGGGCVNRPLREAWAILHDIPYLIGIESGKVDRYQLQIVTPEGPTLTHHYDVDYEVDEALVTVAWTMAWTHELVRGTFDDPRHVVVRYRRTDGSRFMPYWEGSIVLEAVSDDVTAVFIHDEIKTLRSDAASSARTVEAFFNKFIEGEPAFEAMLAARRSDT